MSHDFGIEGPEGPPQVLVFLDYRGRDVLLECFREAAYPLTISHG
jgi:hypothetical protein